MPQEFHKIFAQLSRKLYKHNLRCHTVSIMFFLSIINIKEQNCSIFNDSLCWFPFNLLFLQVVPYFVILIAERLILRFEQVEMLVEMLKLFLSSLM